MRKIFNKKTYGVIFLALTTIFFTISISLSDVNSAETVVYSYLKSLKNGDITSIKEIIDGPLAIRSAGAFRNPDRYGEYLRKQYEGVEMSIVSIAPVQENYHAIVKFDYPSGNKSIFILVMSHDGGIWKIFDEIEQRSVIE